MAKLRWKQSQNSYKVIEAFASRGLGGGLYQICDDGRNGCFVTYQESRRGNRWEIGKTATREEAITLAQAHNDQRLSKISQTKQPADANDAQASLPL
jgi:hypothetical protein